MSVSLNRDRVDVLVHHGHFQLVDFDVDRLVKGNPALAACVQKFPHSQAANALLEALNTSPRTNLATDLYITEGPRVNAGCLRTASSLRKRLSTPVGRRAIWPNENNGPSYAGLVVDAYFRHAMTALGPTPDGYQWHEAEPQMYFSSPGLLHGVTVPGSPDGALSTPEQARLPVEMKTCDSVEGRAAKPIQGISQPNRRVPTRRCCCPRAGGGRCGW